MSKPRFVIEVQRKSEDEGGVAAFGSLFCTSYENIFLRANRALRRDSSHAQEAWEEVREDLYEIWGWRSPQKIPSYVTALIQ